MDIHKNARLTLRSREALVAPVRSNAFRGQKLHPVLHHDLPLLLQSQIRCLEVRDLHAQIGLRAVVRAEQYAVGTENFHGLRNLLREGAIGPRLDIDPLEQLQRIQPLTDP